MSDTTVHYGDGRFGDDRYGGTAGTTGGGTGSGTGGAASPDPVTYFGDAQFGSDRFGSAAPPTPEEVIAAPRVKIIRRVDIYENDGTTPYALDVGVIDGTIDVQLDRAERRSCDLTLKNKDGRLTSSPYGFWYDKIVKVTRGIQTSALVDAYTFEVGTFLIDQITEPHFPQQVSITGRDYGKRLLLTKIPEAIGYTVGMSVDAIVLACVSAAGITNYNIPASGKTLTRAFSYDRGTDRWTIISDLCQAYAYDAFFDQHGVFQFRPQVDPLSAPLTFSFTDHSNLATYTKITNDSEIFNDVIVVGQTNTQTPVSGRAQNFNMNSPTNIGRIGQRTKIIESALVTTNSDCASLAMTYLRVSALESYEVSMDAKVIPWLDVGVAVEFIHEGQAVTDPTRFLLTSLSIPMSLGTMSATAKRVTIVG
jgi:hypothetical protein